MEELRELARSKLVGGFVEDPPFLLSPEFVQGVNLKIDQYWLRTYRANFGAVTEESPSGFSFRLMKMINGKKLDFGWRPDGWQEHCASMGYPSEAHPVSIEVLLRRQPDRIFQLEAPRRLESHPIRYQVREPCVAQATFPLTPGTQVGGMAAGLPRVGTLGGILSDRASGATFAVSCWHVFGDAGNPIFKVPRGMWHRTFARIGEVVVAFPPQRSDATTKCNKFAESTRIDVAVARLDGGVRCDPVVPGRGSIEQVTPIRHMTGGDRLSFIGARSKRAPLCSPPL